MSVLVLHEEGASWSDPSDDTPVALGWFAVGWRQERNVHPFGVEHDNTTWAVFARSNNPAMVLMPVAVSGPTRSMDAFRDAEGGARAVDFVSTMLRAPKTHVADVDARGLFTWLDAFVEATVSVHGVVVHCGRLRRLMHAYGDCAEAMPESLKMYLTVTPTQTAESRALWIEDNRRVCAMMVLNDRSRPVAHWPVPEVALR